MHKSKQAGIAFIFFTVLIDVMGIGLIIPVLPGLIMELKGCTLSEASVAGGTLLVTYALTQFLMAPVIGNISDRFGRRPVLLLALFGLTIDYLFMTWAPTLGWLYLGRVLAGILGSSYTTAQAYIADISTPETRAKNYGMLGAAFGLGFIVGPLVGGLLGEFGLRLPFIAAAVLTFLNFLYGWFIVPESLAPENRRKFEWKRANPVGAFVSLKRNPAIMGLAISMFFVYMAG
ncbi:MAG: MFS transporter, partial [Flavobacteriales bacterium]|nr:MFS transporter [Flavobacteriales bacterium]